MTNTLGSLGIANNNGGIVGPDNDANAAADQTTEITSTGTYSPIAPTGNVLVVAGGGGGGQNGAGGGGGGGAIFYPDYPMPGSAVSVVVGAGTPSGNGGTGGDSEFNDGAPSTLELVAKGGGGGGTQGGGANGGSGGGGGHQGNPNPSPGGSTTQVPSMPAPLQPFGFGNSGGGWNGPPSGAGGGGAGAANNPQPGTAPTNAGVGKEFGASPSPSSDSGFAPFGESGFFSGGGGGNGGGSGGNGGGGNGAPGGGQGQVGTANTGGGGGGGGNPPQPGGGGGSGVILVHEQADAKAVGVWDLKTAYSYIKQGEWPT